MNHSEKQREKFAAIATTEAIRPELRQRSVRGAIYMAVSGGGDFVLRLVSTYILARLLIPEDFGIVAMVTAVTAIAEQFRDLGLSTATVQSREITHEQVTNLFWINVATGAVFSLLICACSPLISAFFSDRRLVPITLAISTNFLWGGLAVQHQALLNRQMKQPQMATIQLGASFLSAVLAVVLAMNGKGYWALVWREVARSLLIVIGMWLLCSWVPGLPYRHTNIRRLLRFGTDLTLAQIAIAAISNVDRLLIGRLFGPGPLGLYRQAQQLMVTPIEQLRAPIYAVSQPGLSMLQADPDRYRRYYRKIVFLVSVATMPLGLFAVIYANEITLLLLGKAWMGAAVFLRIFAVLYVLAPSTSINGLVLITCGQSRRMLFYVLAQSALLAVLLLIGACWSAEGIAWSRVAAFLLMFPMLFFMFRGTPVTVGMFSRAISAPLLAGALMVIGLALFHHLAAIERPIMSLLLGTAVGLAIYATVLMLLPRARNELKSLFSDVVGSLQRKRPVAAGTGVDGI
jgi:O-antigen/teichoic acid export membrane protein